jgi:uncharacterized protein (TIGR00369 family)
MTRMWSKFVEMHQKQWSLEAVRAHVARGLPFVAFFKLHIEEATRDRSIVRLGGSANTERPGGVVAGPVLFSMADVATYALVLASYGDPNAVTVDLTINFLRPVKAPVVATALPLKFGRRLFTAEIRIAAPETPRLLVQATTTWALTGDVT